MAAQAGIRYSLKNPRDYLENNVGGLFNLMEVARKNKIKKFILLVLVVFMALIQKLLLKKILIQVVHYNSMELQKKLVRFFLKTYNYLYNFPIVCLRFYSMWPMGKTRYGYFFLLLKI